MRGEEIVILLVEGNSDFAGNVERLLQSGQKFSVIWKENGDDAIKELERNPEIDLVMMEYFLPGRNGLEVVRTLREMNIRTPIIMITVNKDFDLAVEVMKLGVDSYLVKEEISAPLLVKTILSVMEKKRLREQLMALEVTKHRLEVMRDMVTVILKEITAPIHVMENQLQRWSAFPNTLHYQKYLKIIIENISRITKKIEQLKTLNTDKTVKYIKDIRMIDLS